MSRLNQESQLIQRLEYVKMEKRNFVTSSRTPMEGSSDVDDILDAGAKAFGCRIRKEGAFEKKASEEDEKSDGEI